MVFKHIYFVKINAKNIFKYQIKEKLWKFTWVVSKIQCEAHSNSWYTIERTFGITHSTVTLILCFKWFVSSHQLSPHMIPLILCSPHIHLVLRMGTCTALLPLLHTSSWHGA